ncbi:MAG: lysylphosphatidylglycerol synthase transmembrane domain-containing protein [Burkholderiales bacterium]
MSARSRSVGIASVFTSPAVRIGMAGGLFVLVLSFVDVRAVGSHLKNFDGAVGLAMLGVNAVLLALFAARWQAVARPLGIEAPYARFFCGTWLGAFFSQLGPALVLNEITRFRLLLPYAHKWPLAASQLFDRLSGQIVLAGMILLLTPYYFGLFAGDVSHRIVLMTAVFFILGGSLMLLAHRFRRFIRLDAGALRTLLNPLASPAHYLSSTAIQLLLMVNLGLAAYGLGAVEQSIGLFLVAPLVLGTLTVLPITIADWGSREAAALLFFSASGLSAETVVALSVIYGSVNLVSALPAVLLLTPRRAWNRPRDADK